MTTPRVIGDAALAILADPGPVIMLDTCAILDVLRAPNRVEIQNEVIRAASEMCRRAIPPRGLWLVATTLVIAEWQDNVALVEAELESHIRDLDRAVAGLHGAADFAAPGHTLQRQELAALNLPALLRQTAQAVVDRSLVLAEDDDCMLRARGRVVQGTPPSGKGRQQFKDCEILEHYLALCRALRTAGFTGAAVFISSNKRDYLDATRLHPALQADFASVGMEYTGDFAWALGELRRTQQLPP